ncbi:MAG: ComEC/Rec2 family competence protein [Bacteroidetes bacterium]|nr:ComEC/Rec2 family competence protein [Bacteroidota bacterium]
MNSWRPFPLLRLIFPFLTGIILESATGLGRSLQIGSLIALIFALIFARLFPLFFSAYSLRWISGFVFNLFFILAGYQIASQQRITNDLDFISGQPDVTILASISEPPATTNYGFKATISLCLRHSGSGWKRIAGNAMAYLKSGTGFSELQFGDFILIKADWDSISDNSNPHSFNYTKYLHAKGITHRVFADSRAWRKSALHEGRFLRKFAFRCRDKLLDLLRINHVEGKEFAVAAALLLGYVGDLTPDLMHDYAASGAMHVLSVSGMHVGIIYLFFEFLLGFLNKNKWGRWAKTLILLLFIWFYACLTGLSPCVFRSAAMLTLPILAKSMNRAPNMYNVIAASLIFTLAIDPFLILDVGFQLSYLAVIGLVVLYKPIYDLYITSAWLPDKIWSVLAVSIAAQIATLPITLYVFHQFPNYFLITNLLVVPLSSLIIYVGILLMAVGSIPVLALIVAKCLIFLIWLLNSSIHFIEGLPWSTVTGIHISSQEMLILYIIIITGFLFLTLRQIPLLYFFLIAVIGFMILSVNFRLHRLESSRFLVFNVKYIALFEFSFQDRAIIFYGNGKPTDGVSLKENFKNVGEDLYAHGIRSYISSWIGNSKHRLIKPDVFISNFRFGHLYQFGSRRLLLLNRMIPKSLDEKLRVDYVLISGNPRIIVSDVVKIFAPGMIIIDGTNSRYNIKKWKKESEGQNVKFHIVAEDGAVEKEF